MGDYLIGLYLKFFSLNTLDYIDTQVILIREYDSTLTTFLFFSCFVILVTVVVLAMMIINIVLFFNKSTSNTELESTYECGFIPLNTDFYNFNVNFKNVSILFIIFDLEIVFLLPWAVTFLYLGYVGFYAMVLFFIILSVGLYFEYVSNTLII